MLSQVYQGSPNNIFLLNAGQFFGCVKGQLCISSFQLEVEAQERRGELDWQHVHITVRDNELLIYYSYDIACISRLDLI